MEKVLDNLFGTKNATEEVEKELLQSEPVVEQVSERENYPEPIHVELDDEIIETETENNSETEEVESLENNDCKCDEVDNSIPPEHECFKKELKEILSLSHGLDFELVELRKKIYDLLDKYETHCKIKD